MPIQSIMLCDAVNAVWEDDSKTAARIDTKGTFVMRNVSPLLAEIIVLLSVSPHPTTDEQVKLDFLEYSPEQHDWVFVPAFGKWAPPLTPGFVPYLRIVELEVPLDRVGIFAIQVEWSTGSFDPPGGVMRYVFSVIDADDAQEST